MGGAQQKRGEEGFDIDLMLQFVHALGGEEN